MTELSIGMTIGLDLGDMHSEFCALDSAGAVLRRGKVATTPGAIAAFFGKIPPCRVALEVGTHASWLGEALRARGHQVVVANPRRLKVISESQRKTDRNDAELLARLARSDLELLSPVELRDQAQREALAVVRSRDQLVRMRSSLVNHVRGVIKASGARLPKKIDAAAMYRHRAEVPAGLQPALGPVFDVLESLAKSIAALDKKVDELAEIYVDTKLLTAIRGVGNLTALTFVLTIGDAKRFRRSRQVGAYLGLCPAVRQSGDSDPKLSITKAGDSMMRRLLVNCANYILGPFGGASDLRSWGLRLASHGEPKRARAKAKVAVARKLAVLMHSLLVTGTEYQPEGFGKKEGVQ